MWADKAFKDTVVNRALLFLYGVWHEIKITFPNKP